MNTVNTLEPDRIADGFEHAIKGIRAKCRELNVFSSSALEVKKEILRIQRDQERRKALINLRRGESFILKLEEFQDTVRDVVGIISPFSFLWACIKFLLLRACSTLEEGFEPLLEAWEGIGRSMPSLKGLGPLFTTDTTMDKCLVTLFEDISSFHEGAIRCFTEFPERGRKKIFKSAWKEFEHEITTLTDSIGTHKTLVEQMKPVLTYQQTNGTDGNSSQRLSLTDILSIAAEVSKHKNNRITRFRNAEDAERERYRKQFQATLTWVSTSKNTWEEVHSERQEVRENHPNTCDWIMKQDAVDNWMNVETPTHSILWIHGSMGAGKSTLASFIVDECIKDSSAGPSFRVIYFYCKTKDPSASTCLSIFKGLIHQQLMHIRQDQKYRHLIAYCHDKKDTSGHHSLNAEDAARKLLETFFEIIPFQFVIIDGLDECEKPEIRQCLSLLTSAVARQDNVIPGGLRLLVVSRELPEIKRPLQAENSTANIVKIQTGDNDEAIQLYVEQRLKGFRKGFELNKYEQERIKGLIKSRTAGAQGMFLFAELVLNNLDMALSKGDLLKELELRRFPSTLNEAYDCIVKTIRRNQNNEEKWAKTRAILGWLICAGRTLRWHEIQAIVSMERNQRSVEFAHNKFVQDVHDLCGTLVHVKPGEKVELIHHTAREYIMKNEFIQKDEVEFELALLCMEYLTYPCFAPKLRPSERRDFAKDGFYAFQDYAVSRWFHHIATVVKLASKASSAEGTTAFNNAAKMEKFAEVLDEFTHRYQDSIGDQDSCEDAETTEKLDKDVVRVVEEKARKECESLQNTVFYPMLLNLWVHISKHEKKNLDERNTISLRELESTLEKNRKVIEELFTSAKGDTKHTGRLQEYYGQHPFKCRRTRCDYFYEGLEDAKKREKHMDRHDRPFECTIPGCEIGTAGFISGKDLERHKKNYHMGEADLGDQPVAFPQLNKKKKDTKAAYTCDMCGKKFTRKINQIGHTRSHFGERPFACQNCGKKFTRVNDLRRHEKLHLRR